MSAVSSNLLHAHPAYQQAHDRIHTFHGFIQRLFVVQAAHYNTVLGLRVLGELRH